MPSTGSRGSVSHSASTGFGAGLCVSAATSASAIHAATRSICASVAGPPTLQSMPAFAANWRRAGAGRRHRGRLVEGLALPAEGAVGELLRGRAKARAREYPGRAGRADVDADRHQRDVVLQPERIVLEVVLADVVVIVVVVEL